MKNRNWIVGVVCFLPVLAALDMWLLSEIMGFIREASDISVLLGVLAIPFLLYFHYFLISLLINKLKS